MDTNLFQVIPFLKVNTKYIGALLLAITSCYIALCAFAKNPIRIKKKTFYFPSLRMCLLQIIIGVFDWIITGAILYSLIIPYSSIPFWAFLKIYVIAQIAAMCSQVPGGIGVFDGVMIYFLASYNITADFVLTSLIAYRLIFYIIPFMIAIVLFVVHEIYKKRIVSHKTDNIIKDKVLMLEEDKSTRLKESLLEKDIVEQH